MSVIKMNPKYPRGKKPVKPGWSAKILLFTGAKK
jgi:hypothetical protein